MKEKPFKKELKYPVLWQGYLTKLSEKKSTSVNAEIREAIRKHLKNEGYEL